ncbi:DUF2461 domain-containing protein [Clostridium transplantifaecale]|uniref:DUF2461 domain-containing protein n=1 Tax=Clostridium transplantifaecale TaxID=2479838 RepID=UPI000F63ADD1|nr:DUF2461 domain-containing protein [Clostridium transplantifaecale]
MNTSVILDYLSELSTHNNREWYHAHKQEYREANAHFEMLLQELILKIGEADSSILHNQPKDLTFKLVRDTRFSHDKSPYNPAFRAHISSGGKLPIPVGYFLMIQPGGKSFLGGGLFADVFKDATAMIRNYIAGYPDEWGSIIEADGFRDFFKVQGTSLKRVPESFDKEHPQAHYLKYKSWYLEYPVADELIKDAEHFPEFAKDIFIKMKPFNDYLNQALAGFQMPRR